MAARNSGYPWTPGRIAAGRAHTCVIAADGTVWCWGHNDDGQLGDGRDVPSRKPVQVQGIEAAKSLAAGGTCAVRRDGSVWCWGGRKPPAPVQQIGPASALANGGGTPGRNTCALVDGTVWCWGAKLDPTRRVLVPVPPARVEGLSDIDEVCLGYQYGCARDGTRVRCWDDYKISELTRVNQGTGMMDSGVDSAVVDTISAARQIACMGSNLCAVRADGQVGCVYGDPGMIGHGGIRWADLVWNPGLISGVANAIALVEGSSPCAVQADGVVRCWEFDPYRRYPEAITATTLAGIERPRALAIGGGHTCALERGGQVRCLGDNRLGAVSGGEDVLALTPEPIAGTEGVGGLVAGDGFTCGLRGGQPHCWGWIDTVPGVGPDLASATAVDPAHDVRELGVVPNHPDEPMLCWASRRKTSCFDETSKGPWRTDRPDAFAVKQRLWWGGPECVLTNAGVVECGRTRLDARSFNDGNPPAKGALGSDVVEAARALSMICGRRRSGRVACAKVESTVLRAAEVEIVERGRRQPLADVVALAATGGQICGRRRGGSLACWAPNEKWEIVAEPDPGFTGVREVRFSEGFACAILLDGTVACRGDNSLAQLGDGTVVSREVPTKIRGLQDVRELAVGVDHACARTGDDRVWCWGKHLAGGRGARADRSMDTPATVVQGLPPLLP